MEHIIKRWVDALLVRLGFAPEAGAEQWAAFLLMVVLALLFYLVCRLLLVGGVRHIVSRTRVEWDDVLFSGHVMGRLCQLAAVILLYSVTPAVLIGHAPPRLAEQTHQGAPADGSGHRRHHLRDSHRLNPA